MHCQIRRSWLLERICAYRRSELRVSDSLRPICKIEIATENEMTTTIVELFPHEYKALLDAVRRDLRRETELASTNVHSAAYHNANARLNVRILESLSPKTIPSMCSANRNRPGLFNIENQSSRSVVRDTAAS